MGGYYYAGFPILFPIDYDLAPCESICCYVGKADGYYDYCPCFDEGLYLLLISSIISISFYELCWAVPFGAPPFSPAKLLFMMKVGL